MLELRVAAAEDSLPLWKLVRLAQFEWIYMEKDPERVARGRRRPINQPAECFAA